MYYLLLASERRAYSKKPRDGLYEALWGLDTRTYPRSCAILEAVRLEERESISTA